MRKRWYWFLGLERWDEGYQIGFGLFTAHRLDSASHGKRWLFWWNRD